MSNEHDGKTFCNKHAFSLCSQMAYKIQQQHFGNQNYLHRRQMTRHGKAAFVHIKGPHTNSHMVLSFLKILIFIYREKRLSNLIKT